MSSTPLLDTRTDSQLREALKQEQLAHSACVSELSAQSARNRYLEDLLLKHGFESDGTTWRNNSDLLEFQQMRKESARLKDKCAAQKSELTKIYRKLEKLVGKASFDFTENEYGD